MTKTTRSSSKPKLAEPLFELLPKGALIWRCPRPKKYPITRVNIDSSYIIKGHPLRWDYSRDGSHEMYYKIVYGGFTFIVGRVPGTSPNSVGYYIMTEESSGAKVFSNNSVVELLIKFTSFVEENKNLFYSRTAQFETNFGYAKITNLL